MEKQMSNGMRGSIGHILTDTEISEIKSEIYAIGADITKFRFNDARHKRTCYVPTDDVVYIGGDILPDMKYASNHPRDLMSVRAVLAHEYYGHRTYRQEYLEDAQNDIVTTPEWKDEYRADITAAKKCKALTDWDRYHLVQDAVLRAEEANQIIETDSFMKEVLYGYNDNEKRFIPRGGRTEKSDLSSKGTNAKRWKGNCEMSPL